MKGWLKVLGGFCAGYLFLLVLIGCPILVLLAPDVSGIVAGVITAVGLAFYITVNKLQESNDYGDEPWKYEDYTEEPMKFQEKGK